MEAVAASWRMDRGALRPDRDGRFYTSDEARLSRKRKKKKKEERECQRK